MTPTPEVISRITKAIKARGAPAFARDAGIPYTTLRDWQKRGFCPSGLDTLEKITRAAEEVLAGDRQDAA